MWQSWKMKICKISGIVFFAMFISGCAGTELENKSFPLAVLVAEQDQQYHVCYLSQQLSEVANERADGGNMTAASATGSTYYESHKTFEKNNRCQLDMSHTKAIVFQKNFITGSSFPLFLETVQRENTYARNTLVYISDSEMEKMAKLNSELEIPLGSYLEQMMENDQDMKEQAVVTLGALLNEQANASRTLLIPVLKEEDGLPKIHAYEVVQNFESKGRISTEDAQIYYLLEDKLDQMDLLLAKEEQVRLHGLKCKRNFTLLDGKVTEHLTLTADAEQVTGKASKAEIEQMLKEKTLEACMRNQAEKGIDLSDSSRFLAMYAPKIYRIYGNQAQEYRKNLDYQVAVNIKLVANS